MVFPSHIFAGALDHLPDLVRDTHAAQTVVTLKGRDNFNSEYMYDGCVKNLSFDPLVAESLVIILDKIDNIGGDERTSGTSESNLSCMEILGQDELNKLINYDQIASRAQCRIDPTSIQTSADA